MIKQDKFDRIISKYDGHIENACDIVGDGEPSALFYILADKLSFLLEDDPEKVLSHNGMKTREFINKIVKVLGPYFLNSKQFFENRKQLMDPNSTEQDPGIIVPDEPVIWASNHGFKDDALASVLAATRNAYFLFGSLPQFYNTIDGLMAYINGAVIINRKVKSSRIASLDKCVAASKMGKDEIIYPEGVWNKSPNLLSLKFWPGIYRIAQETNMKIIPVVHYKREYHLLDKNDPIHTVIDDPIDVTNMTEKQALSYLRDVFATWAYLMMEKYGKTTREELLAGYNNSQEAWEDLLKQRIATADYYDTSIEVSADYVDKIDLEILQAWEDIANIQNITPENAAMVLDAKEKVKVLRENNFQRRF